MSMEKKIQSLHMELGQSEIAVKSISAKPLPDRPGIFIGRNSDGDLLVLFADSELDAIPAKKYQNLRIEFSSQYQLEVEGEVITKSFTLLRLTESDATLRQAFCTVVSSVISSLPLKFKTSEVRLVVGKVIDLFSAAPKVSKNAVVGLFGELAIIKYAQDANSAAKAWHTDPRAKTDFSFGKYFLEIKTTEAESRQHHIRSHQLTQPEIDIYIGSVKLTPDTAAENLLEFFHSVLTLLTPENQMHVIDVFFKTIGFDLEETSEMRYSVLGGAAEILIFKAEDLPRPVAPQCQYGAAVANIEFELDFSKLALLGIGFEKLDQIGL